MQRYDEALSQFINIFSSKKEWYIQKEISETYYSLGKKKEALQYAIDAAVNRGDLEKKLDLLILLSKILKDSDMYGEAKKHIELLLSIRLNNEWKIDSDLKELAKKFEIDLSNIDSVESIKKEICKTWEELKYHGQEDYYGFIKSILPHGKAGFVQEEVGSSYYFNIRSFIGKANSIKVGLPVNFYLEDAFDKKKQVETKVAVNIRTISN